jgi:tRNA-2-methylthio-N6-dimethylallyladenosine synthase
MGRNEQNIKVIFPKDNYNMGDFVDVLIERSTTTSLIGKGITK